MKEVLNSRWFHCLYLGMLSLGTITLVCMNIVHEASFPVWVASAAIWVAPCYLAYCAVRFLRSNKAEG